MTLALRKPEINGQYTVTPRSTPLHPVDPAFFVGWYVVFIVVFVPEIIVHKLTTNFFAPKLGWDWWSTWSLPYVAKAVVCGLAGWLLFSLVWSAGVLLFMRLNRTP